jgi:plastocyanin
MLSRATTDGEKHNEVKEMIWRKSFWAAVCIILAFATACGSKQESASTSSSTAAPQSTTTAAAQSTTTAQQPTPAAGQEITIKGFNYGSPLTVSPGAQITVKNDDSAEHTVTSDESGIFDVQVDGKQQATFNAPDKPGTYAFHCTYHSNMKGSLVVQ